ncbi:MAG: hypothetical protein JWQ11_1688, partial [Rhizobacter sp.]|nr:hypothetical protein [Rhizobacter sp.]
PALDTPAPSRQAAARPAPRPAPEVAPAPPPVVVTTRPSSPPAATTAPDTSTRTAAGGSSTDTYQVQSGDTLSRIATRTQRPGVSLDQMLVSLYRSNGDAFVDNNMNRLKTGSVLSVPSTDAVKAIAPGEARQVIQAQSADFQSYRQRLAGVVPTARGAENARRASGQVQAAVDDRKQSAVTTPDRLRLSKSASAAEERIAQENASRDSATRVAELSKNVEQLRRLSGETAASAAAATAAASAGGRAGAAANGGTSVAAVPVTPPAAPSPVPAVVVAPPAVAPASASTATAAANNAATVAAATAAALAASTPSASASVSQAVAAPATPTAPVAAASATAPVVPPVATSDDERSVMDTLLDNPLFLPAVGVLALLLLAAIAFRMRARAKEDSGETSFLESRLQPDSFFGASGGQRIDTRESNGGAASSSMSYSLSQLDAIGDVDPVAEADVYLAYGRDLQAEEILKEAMRSTPDRMAIRTKLLEVYAKRRDTKGYEVLATALFSLTEGMGEDWAKAQEMGLQIDPDNALYQPGGRPEGLQATDSGHMVEPLGASTMPQSILPAATVFQPTRSLDSQSGVDLDLDLGMTGDSVFGTPTPAENTQPFNHDQYRETSSAPTSRFGAEPAAPPSSRFGAETTGNSMNFELPSEFPATYGGKTAAGAAAAGAAAAGAAAAGAANNSSAARPSPQSMADTAPAAFSNPSSFGQMNGGHDSKPLEFDLSDISLDLDTPVGGDDSPVARNGRGEIPDASLDAIDLGMDMDLDGGAGDDGDPLERKFELADEFRQIGDVEGARDLLREVVAKADGTLKSRAQGLLDSMS